MSKPIRILCLVVFLTLLPAMGLAQSSLVIRLSAPQTDTFPTISTMMEVYDEQGRFLQDLDAADLQIIEDDQKIPVSTLEMLHPGLQLVVAMNTGPAFAIRDSQGISRFEVLGETLQKWVGSNANNDQDDLSFLTNQRSNVTHLNDYDAWWETFQGLEGDFRTETPSLQVLSQAIDVAMDTPPRKGMGQAVFFITPSPENVDIPALQNLAARARQGNVRLFIWMISSESLFTSQGAQALQDSASQTGGQFFAFSGKEELPDPEKYFEPQRTKYLLTYQSRLQSGGTHRLAVEIRTRNALATAPALSFDLDVQPPNPVFISPPGQISRVNISEARSSPEAFTPETQIIEILIEFPDGLARPLQKTVLYVDGTIVAENDRQPFDRFTWDLRPFIESGKHTLQVEVVDILGLSRKSIETPIEITIQENTPGLAETFTHNGLLLAGALVVMAGAITGLILVLTGRIQPRSPLTRLRLRSRNLPAEEEPTPSGRADATPQFQVRFTHWASQIPTRLSWPSRTQNKQPFAYLEYLVDSTSPEVATPSQPISITSPEITIGSDPKKASVILKDASVAPLHARLKKHKDGSFTLRDHGTIAGTWVNYKSIGKEDKAVQSGDLLFFGRVGFRFKEASPPAASSPVIIPEEPGK